MTFGGFILGLFNALAAIPQLVRFLEEAASSITLWYISRANNETTKLIADAAAMSARARTQEERYASLDLWRNALSRARVSK